MNMSIIINQKMAHEEVHNEPKLFDCSDEIDKYYCRKCSNFQTHVLASLKDHSRDNHTNKSSEEDTYTCLRCFYVTFSKYLIVRHSFMSECVARNEEKEKQFNLRLKREPESSFHEESGDTRQLKNEFCTKMSTNTKSTSFNRLRSKYEKMKALKWAADHSETAPSEAAMEAILDIIHHKTVLATCDDDCDASLSCRFPVLLDDLKTETDAVFDEHSPQEDVTEDTAVGAPRNDWGLCTFSKTHNHTLLEKAMYYRRKTELIENEMAEMKRRSRKNEEMEDAARCLKKRRHDREEEEHRRRILLIDLQIRQLTQRIINK